MNDSPKTQPVTRGPSGSKPGLQLDPEWTEQVKLWIIPLGAHGLAEKLTVEWNPRLKTTAGLAYPRDCRIEINPALQRFAPTEPQQTIKHELAHLLAHFRSPQKRPKSHGREWQQACCDLGIPNESRCHSLPLERKRVRRRYAYRCPNCRNIVPRVRPLTRASACFHCCRDYNNGKFDPRFIFEQISLTIARKTFPDLF